MSEVVVIEDGSSQGIVSISPLTKNRKFVAITWNAGTGNVLAYIGVILMETPNLYGNLVANTAAGIAGRTGVMPGGNDGADHAIFEQGASAGNVGKENIVKQKKANPVALLLSSTMMLRQHLQFPSFADRLETAEERVILEGKVRKKDLGGDSTTQEVVDAVIANLD